MKMTASKTGWCVFWVCMVIGAIATRTVVGEMVSGLTATEVYEAIARDTLAFQYTLVGWFHTLVISAIVGYGASQCELHEWWDSRANSPTDLKRRATEVAEKN